MCDHQQHTYDDVDLLSKHEARAERAVRVTEMPDARKTCTQFVCNMIQHCAIKANSSHTHNPHTDTRSSSYLGKTCRDLCGTHLLLTRCYQPDHTML
jgi:hypothetical protein